MTNEQIKILLVDDNENDYLIVSKLLGDVDAGRFAITWADTFESGLIALDEPGFDIIFVDYQMPGHTGLEYLQAARRRQCETPIILLTGMDDRAIDIETMQAGAADYLTKNSLTPELLERTIRYALDRRRYAQELRDSETRFRAMVEHSSDATWLLNSEATILYASGSTPRILGYPQQEFVGSKVFDLIHPDDRGKVISLFYALLRNAGSNLSMQYRLLHKDGNWRWVESIKTNLLHEPGVNAVVANHRDITERKQAESALRQSEELYRVMAHNFPNGAIVLFNHELRYLIADGTGLAASGLTREMLEGKTIYEIFPPGICACLEPHYQAALAGKQSIFEMEFSGRAYILHVNPVTNDSGEVTAGMVMTQDITERKLNEARLLESETRFRRLTQANIIGVIISDLSGSISEANDLFLNMLGFSREELELGQVHWDKITAPEYSRADQAAMKQLTEAAVTLPWEQECLRKDGSRLPVLVGATLLEGSQDQFIAFILDLTELKQAEASLRTYATQLEHSNRELQDFAYVASHDLQEPLRKIRSFSDRLQTEYASVLDEDGRDYLYRMQNAAQRMQTLIRDILAFSRVTNQTQPFVTVSLNQIVSEVVTDLETAIEQTNAVIEIGELPVMEADPSQMRQLLQNLLSNALKFHRTDESPLVKVYSECSTPGPHSAHQVHTTDDECRIIVEDNGIGFEVQHQDRIFTPFQRLHTRGQYEGTGIGLTICRKIVQRHGGNITVRSTPGQGSMFIVTLPVKQTKGVGA